MEKLAEGITNFLLDLTLAIVVIVIGYLLVRFILLKLFRRLMRRYGVDEVFVKFASIVLNILLMSLVIIVALDVIGIRTGYSDSGLGCCFSGTIGSHAGVATKYSRWFVDVS